MQKIHEETVIEIIRHFGSVTKMSKKLDVPRASIYRYLEGQSIPERIAKKIECKSLGKFPFKTLISSKNRYYLELETFPDSLVQVPIKDIVISEKIPCFPNQKGLLIPNQRAICINENNQLIYGLEAIENCKRQEKKTVLAWRISLFDLLSRKYEPAILAQTFLLFERTAIGIAAKKYLGNRQGERSDLKLRRNLDEVSGRTDELLASLLQFGNKDSYRQTEKIYLLGCDELIRFVNEGKLKISTAAQLIRFNHKKQQKILIRNKKQILSFLQKYKKNKKY